MGILNMIKIVLFLLISSIVYGYPASQSRETWGYVSVRPGANMFFWLHYTTATTYKATRPVVIWLQGGPGASSTGFGNFEEIGPLTVDLKNRSETWVQEVNVLFIDSPVGTGYSYVNNSKLLPTNNTQVATDLVTFLKGFFRKVPELSKLPIYLFGESYGGKMAVDFAIAINQEIKKKKLNCNLGGVVLGDSWISPVSSVLSWGPYLYSMSLVDTEGLSRINKCAAEVEAAVKGGSMRNATTLFEATQTQISKDTHNVNFYNILEKYSLDGNCLSRKDTSYLSCLYKRHVTSTNSKALNDLMNGSVKQKLNIEANVTWGGQSSELFNALAEDFMKPVTKSVELLLNTTKLPVVIYNGQLDLIVNTPGVEKWASELHWAGTGSWVKAERKPFLDPDNSTIAFTKSFKNFSFYWILRAGHMVPKDQPSVALRLLKRIVGLKLH